MHTLALENNGTVWGFGLNDDKALGRYTAEEEDAFEPGRMELSEKAIQISAGDSHSAALTSDGKVFACGTFKVSAMYLCLVYILNYYYGKMISICVFFSTGH